MRTVWGAGFVAAVVLSFSVAGAASAQVFPVKPVRMVAAAAGAGSDLVSRVLAEIGRAHV